MIRCIQKIIRIGTSGGVTIPAKELRRQNLNFGDEVEVIVRPLKNASDQDQKILDAARQLLNDYRRDFENLTDR
jgi:antitoxin component of MazEF toxin-antitoxin module